jgi:protein-S-isoprenylcysteine O-methyltransferase Ste14
MILDISSAMRYTWEAAGLVWLIGLVGNRPPLRTEPKSVRLFYMALALLGSILLGSGLLREGWLAMRFIPYSYALRMAGLALTIAGCLLAIWARVTLGGNWSDRVSLLAGQTLTTSGPYTLARHPIYSGLLLAALGTALTVGEWRCLLGLVLLLLAAAVKISQEEKLMHEVFPEEYALYRQRVRALIPGLL